MWDYGTAADNLAHYNTTKPPVYHYSGLEVPTVFFSGGNDYLGRSYFNTYKASLDLKFIAGSPTGTLRSLDEGSLGNYS